MAKVFDENEGTYAIQDPKDRGYASRDRQDVRGPELALGLQPLTDAMIKAQRKCTQPPFAFTGGDVDATPVHTAPRKLH